MSQNNIVTARSKKSIAMFPVAIEDCVLPVSDKTKEQAAAYSNAVVAKWRCVKIHCDPYLPPDLVCIINSYTGSALIIHSIGLNAYFDMSGYKKLEYTYEPGQKPHVYDYHKDI